MRIRQTRTRTTAVAVSLFVVLGLSACSGDDSTSDGATDTAATEAPADDTSEAPSEDMTDESTDESTDAGTGDTEAEGGTDFCDATKSIAGMSSAMSEIDGTDMQAAVDQLEELTSTLESVDEPPAEVADDWNAVATTFRSVTDGLTTAAENPTDPDAMTEATDAMSALQDQSFQDAGQGIATYASTNC